METRGRLLPVLVASILLATLFPGAATAQTTVAFGDQTPAPGSVVSAGQQTVAVRISGRQIADVAILLNTEPLLVEHSGDSAEMHVSSQRMLAPGNYTVTVVVRDVFLGLRVTSWRFQVRLTDQIPEGFSQLDAKVQIVYPHDGALVTQATLVNIGVFLSAPGTLIPVPMAFDRPVRLWRAVNASPAQPVALGVKVIRNVEGRVFPAWEFNDIDVSAARDPSNRLFFFVTVDNIGTNNNVWVHAADPRTFLPHQDVPVGLATWPNEVDPTVQIVYPHHGGEVSNTPLANIGVDVFAHGAPQSVDFSRDPLVYLLRSENAAVATYGATGERVAFGGDGVERPRWVFNDVDVSAANLGAGHSLVTIFFWARVEGISSLPSIWAHDPSPQTNFPRQDVPSQSAQGLLP